MKDSIVILFLLLLSQLGYGQGRMSKVIARPWVKGQKDPLWKKHDTRTIAQLDGLKATDRVHVNEYGNGLDAPKHRATGFFRVEHIGNRQWIIDPDGYRHLQKMAIGVRLGTSERNKQAMLDKFGTEEKWTEKTAQVIHLLGFLDTDSWSNEEAIASHNTSHKEVLTRSIILSLISRYGKKRGGTYQLPGNTRYPSQRISVFDPEFETYYDEMAQKLVASKMNKNIIGYFPDNELPFGPKNLKGYLILQNPGDPRRVYTGPWSKRQGTTSWRIADEHQEEFARVVAERYYKVVSEVVREYDPNHLYLGSRLHGKPKFIHQIVEAVGKHCDVAAVNYYGTWTPSEKTMKRQGERARKPFIIMESYTKGMDPGLANTTGTGLTTQAQQERRYAYQHFILGLLESGNCVGWHWFHYQNNDPTVKGAGSSNLDSNKGLIGNGYNLYKPLTDTMKELNVNACRLAGWFDQQSNNDQ